MEQPVPRVSEDDVLRVVRRDFSPDQFDAVMTILSEYGMEEWEPEAHRVRLAILKLADGSLDVVRRQLDIAKCDYRDVLALAENPGYMQPAPPSERASGPDRQRIIRSDWNQYQSWLTKE